MFNVTFYTYSGMPIPLAENVSREEAKEAVRKRLRRGRYLGLPISKIGKGRWEFETPEDAMMVSDEEGILSVKKSQKRRF